MGSRNPDLFPEPCIVRAASQIIILFGQPTLLFLSLSLSFEEAAFWKGRFGCCCGGGKVIYHSRNAAGETKWSDFHREGILWVGGIQGWTKSTFPGCEGEAIGFSFILPATGAENATVSTHIHRTWEGYVSQALCTTRSTDARKWMKFQS